MQNDPVVSKASEMLRLGLMPSPDELKTETVSATLSFDFPQVYGLKNRTSLRSIFLQWVLKPG